MKGINRIIKEFRDLNRDPLGNCGITIGLFDEDNYKKWRVGLMGPKDTSYNGGLFFLSITFPENYPDKSPEVCFLTPIYHLNINYHAPKFPGSEPLGFVSLSTLFWWKTEYTIRKILVDIFALFYMNNPDSPYGMDRAEEFRDNRQAFEEKVKYFTKKYAHPMRAANFPPSDKDWISHLKKNNVINMIINLHY